MVHVVSMRLFSGFGVSWSGGERQSGAERREKYKRPFIANDRQQVPSRKAETKEVAQTFTLLTQGMETGFDLHLHFK